MFSLEKWYLDAVDHERRALIAYWARLRVRGVSLTWQSVTRYAPDGSRVTRRSLRNGRPPLRTGSGVEWDAARLGARFRLEGTAAPVAEELLGPGKVVWTCVAPAAMVEACFDDQEDFEGVGYAECLRMTTPPWRLPLRELRWGRWCDASARHSLVWIAWHGETPPAPCSWVYLDGRRVNARVTDDGVGNEDFTLTLSDWRELEHRSFGDIARGVPRLLRVLPSSMRAMREAKWLSTGRLRRRDDGLPMTGLSIHEIVKLA